MARSTALVLCALLLPSSVAAALCAEPGRDGNTVSGSALNSYFSGPDSHVLTPGSRTLTLPHARGSAPLRAGDLALLMQVQGAPINTSNSARYGQLGPSAQPLQTQEWVRIEQVDGTRVKILGGGVNAGLIHAYHNAPASDDQGRRRWQLVRVPQFDSLTLQQSYSALPWDGKTGGVLALDVRRQLDLNGHRLSVRGAGFRGAPALSLQGALGRPDDWRYATPAVEDRAVGYGHHASKGEGIAGTPQLLMSPDHSGYPLGDMGRGAPANAGGGGNGLNFTHRQRSSGGGGGNGVAGQSGGPEHGGGKGGYQAPQGWVFGGGGGAAVRRQGQGGDGGNGGGLLVIRAARLIGEGRLDLAGLPGVAITGEARQTSIGGGGGAGGTLWLDTTASAPVSATVTRDGGLGGGSGGAGGTGQALASREGMVVGGSPFAVAGVEAGFRCRPAGHWITGTVFEDNGAGQPALALNGRVDPGERGLLGWSVLLSGRDSNSTLNSDISTNTTGENGHFQFRLSEAHSRGQPLALELVLPPPWRAPRIPPLQGVPGEHDNGSLQWRLRALPDQHSGPLELGVVALPQWQGPHSQHLQAGSTAVLQFTYRASLTGTVRFASDHPAVHSLLMDRHCSGNSEQWQGGRTAAWPVTAGERLCVRVPVLFPGNSTAITVTATTELTKAPEGFSLPVQTATVKIHPSP